MSTSYKPEVKAFGEDSFCCNGLCFATEQEAQESAKDLRSRWIMVEEIRAVESNDLVNYKRENGKDVHI